MGPVDSLVPVVLSVVGAVVGIVVGAVVGRVGVLVSPLVGRVVTSVFVFAQPQPTSIAAPKARTNVKIANFFIGKPPIFLCAKLVFPEHRRVIRKNEEIPSGKNLLENK
jgi:hypothetical protein